MTLRILTLLLVLPIISAQVLLARKPKPVLGEWVEGVCQREEKGTCSQPFTCCPKPRGIRMLTRSCTGVDCHNEKLTKTKECLYNCLREATWTTWASEGCTPDCGSRKTSIETFTRLCVNVTDNTHVVDVGACKGSARKQIKCTQKLPPCGQWSDWEADDCSASCGKGTQKFTRVCLGPGRCTGNDKKHEDCQTEECGTWTAWVQGICSASCDGGKVSSIRGCTASSSLSLACEGDVVKTEDCNTTPCGSGTWSRWITGACSVSCGNGTRTVLRKCSTPGACEGSEEIVEDCNATPCGSSNQFDCGSDKGYSHNGYRYVISDFAASWTYARKLCKEKGGDLAYHGFDNLETRGVIRSGLNLPIQSMQIWFGLQKVGNQWRWLNGSTASSDTIHWYSTHHPSTAAGDNCGRLESSSHHWNHPSGTLTTVDNSCFYDEYFFMCEFECSS